MLSVEDVVAGYVGAPVLRGINMEIDQGEFVTLVGPNGAGKTTLFRVITGFLSPSKGSVFYAGQPILKVPTHELVHLGIGQVAEGRQLFTGMSVIDNLELARYYGERNRDSSQSMQDIFELFPILEERRDQTAGTLSGGEQQMLAIARALMIDPEFLLLDEPSLGLAPLIVKDIFEAIKSLNEQGITILLIEQNARAALRASDRGYVMEKGEITLSDDSDNLLNNSHVQEQYLGVSGPHSTPVE